MIMPNMIQHTNDYAKYDSTYKWLCQIWFNIQMIMPNMIQHTNDYAKQCSTKKWLCKKWISLEMIINDLGQHSWYNIKVKISVIFYRTTTFSKIFNKTHLQLFCHCFYLFGRCLVLLIGLNERTNGRT